MINVRNPFYVSNSKMHRLRKLSKQRMLFITSSPILLLLDHLSTHCYLTWSSIKLLFPLAMIAQSHSVCCSHRFVYFDLNTQHIWTNSICFLNSLCSKYFQTNYVIKLVLPISLVKLLLPNSCCPLSKINHEVFPYFAICRLLLIMCLMGTCCVFDEV